jgi:hypothetical protein
MYKWKIISAYVFFVGMPLLALVGILRAGAHLTPPLAVRGRWFVSADFSSWRSAPCEARLANAPEPLLNITQSGKDLTIQLNDTETVVMVGTINGGTVMAAYPDALGKIALTPMPGNACPSPKLLRLQANVEGQGKQRSLNGTLAMDGCAGCPSLAFRAFRQAPEGKTEQ